MEELIVGLLLVENAWCQKQSWSFMHLLCSGMVGLVLQRNLETTEKEHSSLPFPPLNVGGVLHQLDHKQMVPFTSTDEECHYLSYLQRGEGSPSPAVANFVVDQNQPYYYTANA